MKDDILNPKKITGGAKCPKCAEYSLFAEGIQLRSADEGQSELMRCDNCGFLKVIK
jgi:DNA-directed RNA polymerase subunit M/transcription elongation factor TFIIS